VLEIYAAYVALVDNPLPLWIIGSPPSETAKRMAMKCAPKGRVEFFTELSNEQVCAAYSCARLLLFPSVAEGFGWPIAEAMACGCPVVTTDEPPMTEVGGDAAFYIPKRPSRDSERWARHAAEQVIALLMLDEKTLVRNREQGLEQVARFDADAALTTYERLYRRVLETN
jgi:glycosyltransferase involved in cell wall biosynthesis